MKTNHTPGAWHVAKTMDGKNLLICDMKGTMTASVALNHLVGEKEANANAKLIASAPDLLDALKQALNIFGRGYKPKEGAEETIGSAVYLIMEKAIKKATI